MAPWNWLGIQPYIAIYTDLSQKVLNLNGVANKWLITATKVRKQGAVFWNDIAI